MRLTPEGYAKKVRQVLTRNPRDLAAVFVSGGVLNFCRLGSVPELIAVYDLTAPKEWIIEDAKSIGLRES